MTDMPNRPDVPEFWQLAYIVSRHDATMDAAADPTTAEAVLALTLGGYGLPPRVAEYVSMQRAMRAAGVTTAGQLREHGAEVAKLAACWLDGFAAGAAYTLGRQGADRDRKRDHGPPGGRRW
jgi:hypothetical protein